MKVYDSLHYGRENAIPSKVLAEALGFRSVRELQKAVEAERAAGAVILCDSQGAGYYLSDDPEELRRFTRTLRARARNTIRAAESAQKVLEAATKEKAAPELEPPKAAMPINDGDSVSQKVSFRNEEN